MPEDIEDALMLTAVLAVALLGALPQETADRLLVAIDVAFERIGPEQPASAAALERAHAWWISALPALLRASG